ncbi:MAG: aminotransferase class V-fold PLP-dependent enzyme [Deltaproteobacteria bacterium]|nr:aminotransferase class V-fold PLP-dependent enzyme [Deltaproteobacteria bacterium]
MTPEFIYLDNAATTFPKPEGALEHMVELYKIKGVSPGRGGYDLAFEAEDIVFDVRSRLARLFNTPDPERVVFTSNATDSLNIALQGILKKDDHVVSTRLEHNSVLRPLYHLREKGHITYDLIDFDSSGCIDPDDISGAIKKNTKLVVINHVSNVLGAIQPIKEIGEICAKKGALLIVDAAQSAGIIPVNMADWNISAVAFTGHKSLLGPTGTGGLAVSPELEIEPVRFGGTGIDSESPVHNRIYPHRLEAGTVNMIGIIGLSEGLRYIETNGMESIHKKEMELLCRLRDGLSKLESVIDYCADDDENHAAVLTVNIRGIDPGDAGSILDADYGIAVRTGLHCAPHVHENIGTFPGGAVRFSIGPFNTAKHIDTAIEAMTEIDRFSRH